MRRREIIIVTDENDLAKTKEALAAIKISNHNLLFTPPIQGSIGSLILLTIKVAAESFEPLLEIIIRKRLRLFTKEDKEKAETALKKKIAEQEDGCKNQYVESTIDIDTPSPHDLFNKTIDDYAKEGNYRALIAYYKDAKQKSEIKFKAKKNDASITS